MTWVRAGVLRIARIVVNRYTCLRRVHIEVDGRKREEGEGEGEEEVRNRTKNAADPGISSDDGKTGGISAASGCN